jgi:AcrR family transcriptional regulator
MMIRAAYVVLSHRASGTVTVNEILAEAGLSTRSFYRHFRSKDELLLAMYEAEAEGAWRELDSRLRRAADPRSAVEEWVRFYVSLASELRRHRRVIVMNSLELIRVPGYAETHARTLDRNRATLVRVLEAGAVDGSFRHTRPASDALMIQDIVGSMLIRRRQGEETQDAESVTGGILEFLGRALGFSTDQATTFR